MNPDLQSVDIMADGTHGTPGATDVTHGGQQDDPALPASPDTPRSATQDPTAAHQEFNKILERLDQLRESFDSKLLYDRKKDDQINFLHSEIKQGQERLFQQMLRPLYFSLIKLHDLIGEGRKAPLKDASGAATIGESIAAGNYQTYQGEIEEILLSNGVMTYRTEPGQTFDPTRHQARETLPTTGPSQANTIAESQRPGFTHGSNVLRPEWVKVYRDAAGNQS